MLAYQSSPVQKLVTADAEINSFILPDEKNLDKKTVDSFGDEWSSFHSFDDAEIEKIGDEYFDIVKENQLNKNSLVLDVGCGSGRWSKYVASKAKFVEAVDPSNAVYVASKLTSNLSNVRVTQAGVSNIPFANDSFDFVFSLGVLHHIPNTQQAMQSCVEKLKSGGYFLVYLYYRFDNKSDLFKLLFAFSNVFRLVISKMPHGLKKIVCNLIAAVVYFPLAKISSLVKNIFGEKMQQKIPLFYYANKSFYIMQNDALDRFGTPLEQRFTKKEIEKMMIDCGLTEIVFSAQTPYWHAIGKKK